MSNVDGGLNPYCSGQWSRTVEPFKNVRLCLVLILIVVDNGLVLGATLSVTIERYEVLILIVVDNGLVPHLRQSPYLLARLRVLILIVVDNGLVLNLTRHY